MKVLMLTREYPPYIYGGAGVHVKHLVSELAKIMQVKVRCFGDQQIKRANLKKECFVKIMAHPDEKNNSSHT